MWSSHPPNFEFSLSPCTWFSQSQKTTSFWKRKVRKERERNRRQEESSQHTARHRYRKDEASIMEGNLFSLCRVLTVGHLRALPGALSADTTLLREGDLGKRHVSVYVARRRRPHASSPFLFTAKFLGEREARSLLDHSHKDRTLSRLHTQRSLLVCAEEQEREHHPASRTEREKKKGLYPSLSSQHNPTDQRGEIGCSRGG